MDDEMQQKLQAYYRAHFPDGPAPQVSHLTDITTGWECEVFSFDVDWQPPREPAQEAFVLRLYSGDDGSSKSEKEFFILSQLSRLDFPVPKVYFLEKEGAPFGKPFIIMEKIDGKEMWSALDQLPRDQQIAMVSLFVSLYVRLHALDWHPFAKLATGDLATDPYAFIDWFLGMGQQVMSRFAYQGFVQALAWLKDRRDRLPCDRPVLAHMDYHPANVLMREDGTPMVIDWTASAVLDRRFDLAWTCLLTEIYAGKPVRDFILSEYERISGEPVKEFDAFEVMACMRRLSDIMISVTLGAEKQGMRPGAEEVMKQQAGPLQKVYDIFSDRTGLRVPEVEELIQSLMLK